MPQLLRCEVVYALPDRQFVVAVALAQGASVRDAIVSSGICSAHAELHASLAAGDLHVGVFGRIVTLDRALRDGDRVEIYRPLRIDPKAARRARAARTRR